MTLRLNILGCGHLGRALGQLWHRSGYFRVQDIINRSAASASAATTFIGGGRPLGDPGRAAPAELWLIGAPDNGIGPACEALYASALLRPGDTVFHCSGALPSTVLAPARAAGAHVASIHPIKSFAVPQLAADRFAGTWCGVEGDRKALQVLEPAFHALGAHTVAIDLESKSIYHAAAVFASNYLVTLVDLALQAYEKAGVPRETALQLVAPLVHGTMENVLAAGPVAALSGPIARGDAKTVLNQHRALRRWDKGIARIYRTLAKPTCALARRQRRRA